MPDLQRYPCNYYLIKNVKDIVDFLTEKVFISVSFSIALYKEENIEGNILNRIP